MKISIVTLGCKVNEYESQSMFKQLENAGYEVTEGLVPADYYIINTCAVTNMAERKSRQVIAKIKKLNPNAKILVCGCASQNNLEQFNQYDEVIGIIGTHGKHNIVEYLEHKGVLGIPETYQNTIYAKSTLTRQYIKIQDGCNNFCTYCIIPYTRGRSRSRDLQDILTEIKQTSAREIVLTGINVSDYKIDGKHSLIDLLEEIDKVNIRFRLSSLECVIIDDNFIERLKKLKNFCPFFHLSLQSACNETLKRMNRHYTIEEYIEVCNKLKLAFPNCCISTDLIVGFKGETDEEFEETFKNLQKIPFSFIHIFPYSVRKGTNAEKLSGDVPSLKVKEREKKLTEYNKKIYEAFVKSNINTTHKLLIEEFDGTYSYGYTENYIYCAVLGEYIAGSVINVKIEKQNSNNVIAQVV